MNEDKLNELVGKMLVDIGAAANGPLVVIGDRLGLYRELAASGPLNSQQLADNTGTAERYVREWLAAQAASGYVEYDTKAETFSMTPEQQAIFVDENSPVLMTGAFYSLESTYIDEPKVAEAFKTGEGVTWGDHSSCLFCGTAKFFRPSYQTHLIHEWIPALTKVDEKLTQGCKVGDVGCGFGISTTLMAKHYPKSEFFGFDIHEPSIIEARKLAKEEGVTNVTFEVSSAKTFPGDNYGVVCCFDCLHDMGDPAGASKHINESMADDGTWMIVEPFAHDRLEDNLNPIGRVFYGFSTTVCTPSSLGQEVGAALGAQAGEKRLREVVEAGGFTKFRRATETPFNMILEASK
jgi:2-polyprenyl-3-methyl-5-hydroxy-6-metoxy-1,4-benzoquinol methylase